MSYFRSDTKHLSRKKFRNLPAIGNIPAVIQAPSSDDNASSISELSSGYGESLREGCLITGAIDITNERARMVTMAPGIKNEDRAGEKENLEKYLLSLKIIPQEYRDKWHLDHPSNTVWLTAFCDRHHDMYATILIAPSAQDSERIRLLLESDNSKRIESIKEKGYDPGRSQEIDWFQDTTGKYELIVPYSSYFLTGGCSLLVRHPTTQSFTNFYVASDGFLHEGSPTGPRLSPFGSRGEVNRDIALNPILVNFAAVVRLRYVDRQIPGWRESLDAEAKKVLDEVESLHRAVVWETGQKLEQSSHGNLPAISWKDATELMHTDFESLPDWDFN